MGMDWLWPGWYYFGREKTKESNATRAREPVWPRTPVRPVPEGRKSAGLSGWPSSEPCKAGAGGRLLQCDPSACETCSEDEPLSRCCPKRFRRRFCASEDWAAREVLLRHRRVDREGLPGRGPFSRAFRWPERCGHFRRGRYSSEAVRCAFRCPLGRTFFFAQGAKPVTDNHVGIVT
jgi:hypothetical protein